MYLDLIVDVKLLLAVILFFISSFGCVAHDRFFFFFCIAVGVAYELVLQSLTPNYTGVNQEFSGASDLSKQLFKFKVDKVSDCESLCSALANCEGFYYFIDPKGARQCKGLSALGSAVTSTVESSSYAKSVSIALIMMFFQHCCYHS